MSDISSNTLNPRSPSSTTIVQDTLDNALHRDPAPGEPPIPDDPPLPGDPPETPPSPQAPQG